jgi:peptidyl-Asp metalloendopeptidase
MGGGAAPESLMPFADADRRKLEAKNITIDVMMLYTKKVTNRYIQSPADQIELAIEQANETFRNSGLGNVCLRLVHTQLVDYDETGSQQFDHLYRMVDGIGAFKDIHRLRNEQRADIVGLMVEDPSGCGLSTRVGADEEEAYFVVHHSCAALTNSVAHEIGHLLGARHDRITDVHNSPFPYGHGYINGSKWRDIMSYAQGCDGCPRIPFWSNPRIMYRGEPTGTLAEDNARVILEQAERVSKFR